MGEERQDAHSTPTGRKLSVSEAAGVLGISAEAVRSRLKRGTLRSVKEGEHVYVLLSPDQMPPEHQPGTDQTTDQSPLELMREMMELTQERIRYLERQVEEEREARRRADMLLARLVERIPELEAPATPEPTREASESPEPRSDSPTPTDAGEGQQTPKELPTRRPWVWWWLTLVLFVVLAGLALWTAINLF